MAEAEVKTFWQRQRLAEAEVENPHVKSSTGMTMWSSPK